MGDAQVVQMIRERRGRIDVTTEDANRLVTSIAKLSHQCRDQRAFGRQIGVMTHLQHLTVQCRLDGVVLEAALPDRDGRCGENVGRIAVRDIGKADRPGSWQC